MANRIKFTKEQIDDISLLYKSGTYSCNDIAIKYNVAKNTIREILKRVGIERTNRCSLISAKSKGRISHKKGLKLPAETCRKIGDSKIGNKYCVGRIVSDETRRKMSLKRIAYIQSNPNWNKKLIEIKKTNGMPQIERKKREKIRGRYKNLLRRLMRQKCYIKHEKTCKVLGYSFNQFKEHIESQFKEGMSWDKRDSFHIDHIIPISILYQYGITNPMIVNCLYNLQVLTPDENRKKSDNYDMDKYFGSKIFDLHVRANETLQKNGLPAAFDFI